MKRPTAIDLFCGAGGLTLGLRRGGFRVIGAVDNDQLAVDTFHANHPDVRVWQRDIRKLEARDLKRVLKLKNGELDLLAGCPPCQGFSTMRTFNGSKRVRTVHQEFVFEFLRFVRGLRPKTVMLENVPGLAKDRRIVTFCVELARLGYECEFRVLDAANYGVAQRRRRVILLAGRHGRVPFGRRSTVFRSVRHVIGLGKLPNPGRSGDPCHDLPERRSKKVIRLIQKIPHNGGSRADLSGRFQLKCEPVPYAKLDNPQSLNLYAYVGNNPLRFIDADGHYELNASGCGDNAKCQKKWDKAANKFEARREKDLNSKKADIRTAAANYGARGEANGVYVGFANLNTGANPTYGSVDPSGSVGGTPLIQVTLDFGRAGSAETETHEGTHVGDDQKFLNSYDPLTGGYSQSLNPTHGQTEFNAFRAGAEVNQDHGFGPNDTQKILNFLHSSPTYGPIFNLPVFDPNRFPAGVSNDEQ